MYYRYVYSPNCSAVISCSSDTFRLVARGWVSNFVGVKHSRLLLLVTATPLPPLCSTMCQTVSIRPTCFHSVPTNTNTKHSHSSLIQFQVQLVGAWLIVCVCVCAYWRLLALSSEKSQMSPVIAAPFWAVFSEHQHQHTRQSVCPLALACVV